jgi:hypothetical protein
MTGNLLYGSVKKVQMRNARARRQTQTDSTDSTDRGFVHLLQQPGSLLLCGAGSNQPTAGFDVPCPLHNASNRLALNMCTLQTAFNFQVSFTGQRLHVDACHV